LAFDPEDSVLYPLMNNQKMNRMASPLILKPMWNGDNYTPIALLLPHNHLTQMGVRLENSATGTRDFQPGQWWQINALTLMTSGASANPLQGRTGDVLNDFLDFFRI
jgi:CRISPR-associated protein Cmr1